MAILRIMKKRNVLICFCIVLSFLGIWCIVKDIQNEKTDEIYNKYVKIKNKYNTISNVEKKTEELIETKMNEYSEYVEQENKKVAMGNYIKINYIIYENDKVVARVQEQVVEVGKGVCGSEVDDAVIGKIKGERLEIKLEKNKIIKVKIINVYNRILPEFTEEFVMEKFNISKAEFYENVMDEVIVKCKDEAVENIIDKLSDDVTMKMDVQHVDIVAKSMVDYYVEEAAMYQETLYQYMKNEHGVNEDEIAGYIENQARSLLKENFVLSHIIKKIDKKKYAERDNKTNNYVEIKDENEKFREIIQKQDIAWVIKK